MEQYPEEVSLEQLTAAYEQMGFHCTASDPATFERAEDRLVIFHSHLPNGMFALAHIWQDISLVVESQAGAHGLESRFLHAIRQR